MFLKEQNQHLTIEKTSTKLFKKNRLNNLPPIWSWIKLGEVCEISPKMNANGITDNVEVSFLPMKAVQELSGKIDLSETRRLVKVKKGYTYFGDGDVIFAKITPCMENGKVAITTKLKNGIGFGSTEFHVLRPYNNLLNTYLFFFLIQGSYRNIAQRNMTGTAGQLRVPKRFIENSEIPLPPLSEQKKIVKKIEKLFSGLDSGVASLKKAKEQIKLYRQSVLSAAFSGRLSQQVGNEQLRDRQAVGKNEYLPYKQGAKKAAEPDVSYTAQLPAGLPNDLSAKANATAEALAKLGWKWVKLGEVVKIVSGNTPKGLEEISDKGNIPFYKVSDMNSEGNKKIMFNSNLYLTKNEIEKLKIKIFPKNTTIFPKRGGAILTNKKRLLNEDSAFDLNIMGAVPSEIVNYKFLHYWFIGLDLSTIYDGSNVPQINNKNVEPLDFPLPPLPQQTQIVEEIEKRFTEADSIEKAIDNSLSKAEMLRQSILKQAFEGKLI